MVTTNRRKKATRKQTALGKLFSANYEEIRRRMYLYVAQEIAARYSARQLAKSGKGLNYKSLKRKVAKSYEEMNSQQILEDILHNVYWLASEQAVIDLYYRYQDDAAKANERKEEEEEENDLVLEYDSEAEEEDDDDNDAYDIEDIIHQL